LSTCSKSSTVNLTCVFAPHLSSGAKIYYPSDTDYAGEVVPRYSLFDPPSFLVTILPATVQDVQNIVGFTYLPETFHLLNLLGIY
jgi:hypothetical protein